MKAVYKRDGPPFFGKCSYCESYVLHSQRGDIDHWRPIRTPTDEHNSKVTRARPDGSKEFHEGYYWLAYDWRNLLLACQSCNGQPMREPDGTMSGKGNRFPVDGFRAWDVGEESLERPLLLHPVIDDPSEHLEVDLDTGCLIAKTDRGQMSIAVFGLNSRQRLVKRRLNKSKSLRNKLKIIRLLASLANADTKVSPLLQEWRECFKAAHKGDSAYSAVGRAVIEEGRNVA